MAEKRPRLLQRQQPHIETLQVSVQVVRIGPKQMTQAVFRQLKNEALVVPDTLELRGVPWGTVNYTPGDCPPISPHLHVIWQTGEDLRRDCFPLRYDDATLRGIEGHLWEAVTKLPSVAELFDRYLRTPHTPAALRAYLAHAEAFCQGPSHFHWARPHLDAFARALDALEAAFPGIQQRRARWQEHVEEIEALPQLFIAV